jgi:hypothetical protein
MNANYLKPLAIALLLGLMPLTLTSAVAAADNRGPAGPVGKTGPAGPAGPKGAAGASGPVGPIGPQGPSGLRGPAGANGTNGVNGTPGLAGAPGTDGTPGAPGSNGGPGKDGINGIKGSDGTDGIDGVPGTPGVDGTPSTPGNNGINGINGIDGKNSRDGITAGDMTFWNGTEWVMLPAGAHNTNLKTCEGVPTWVVTDCPSGFVIGDTGPGGGIVFNVTPDGLHGLEAAPGEQVTSTWGCIITSITGTSTIVGSGKANTDLLVAGCADADTAAKVAAAYSLGAFDDWYLPSKDELALLQAQMALVTNFTPSNYWSSSEDSYVTAWVMGFYPGGTFISADKSFSMRVWPIRSF